jgi:hypothetical protein
MCWRAATLTSSTVLVSAPLRGTGKHQEKSKREKNRGSENKRKSCFHVPLLCVTFFTQAALIRSSEVGESTPGMVQWPVSIILRLARREGKGR